MEQIVKADYAQAVKAIKQAIVVCRYRAARQMNGEVLGLYYSIGKYISEQSRNAQWGTGAIRTISEQLQQEIPGLRGFSEGNMRKMRLFYGAWQPVFEPQAQAPFAVVSNTSKIELIDFRSAVANELADKKCSPVANELTEYDLECFLSIGFTLHSDIILQTNQVTERLFYIRKTASEFIGKTYRSVSELPDTYKALPSAEELRKLL